MESGSEGTLKVAVIGAGIVGSSVAYRLSEGGAEVVMIDGAEPGSGTTSTSFAWVNANNKLPRDYFELNVAGMREHEWLRDEIDGDWLHATGNLIWAEDQQDLEERVERLRSWSYPAEMLPASAVVEELEPGADLPEVRVAHFPEESWVDAPALTRALVEAAGRGGARRASGIRFAASRPDGEGVTLRLESGDAFAPMPSSTPPGRRPHSVAEMVGRELPLDVFPGLLVRVAVPGEPLRHLMHTPRINVRPDGPGYVLLHHDSVDERAFGRLRRNRGSALRGASGRARRVLPALEEAEVVEAQVRASPGPGGRAFLRRRALCDSGLLRGRDAQRRHARPTHRAAAGA